MFFLLGKVRDQDVPCRFCGGADGDGHLFWECPIPPVVETRENPEFHDLVRMDKSQWRRCLLWHGWLPLLSGTGCESPWAAGADDAAVGMLESALGAYSSDILQGWDVPESADWDPAADMMPPDPDVWTDGSLVRDEVSGSAFAGAGVYARLHADTWRYRLWGQFDDLGLTPDGLASSCVGFSSLPSPLQTVQRAELWSVVLALQATNAVHLGVDNLNVVGHVGRPLHGSSGIRLLELEDDGDLIILIRKLLSVQGEGTVCISKVKGHADESLVRNGQVRALDRYGNIRADEAADFGRRGVWPEVTDARRNLSGVCRRWYPGCSDSASVF